jgi:multidrug resistance efflux pump
MLASIPEVKSRLTPHEVSQARVAKAQAKLRLAEQQVQQAKTEQSLLTIAPKDGRVSRVRVQTGEYVAGGSGQPLTMISR